MRSTSARLALAWLLAALPATTRATADEPVAEALFKEGRRLLLEGKLDVACEKLAESQRLDPSSGTLLNLALCYEEQGRLATAWAAYVSTARLARAQLNPERADTAEQRAAKLEPRLPLLTIRAAHPIADMKLVRDGEQFGVGVLDTATPVDPGPHEITATAPNHRPWSTKVEAIEGSAVTVVVPALERAPQRLPRADERAPAPPQPARSPTSTPLTRPAVEPSGPDGRDVAGYVLGGAGTVVLGFGAFSGVQSLRAYDRADTACPTHSGCTKAATSDRDAAESAAWVADVAIPLGVLGIASGLYLLLTDSRPPHTDRAALTISPVGRGALFGRGALCRWSGRF